MEKVKNKKELKKKKLAWVKNLKDKNNPNDKKKTPLLLAKRLIDITPLKKGDFVLDPFAGKNAFYNQYPSWVKKDWCEIDQDRDFFKWSKEVDWILSNPPYSKINDVFKHSVKIAKKGIGLLIGIINITPKRLKILRNNGFGVTVFHICQVRGWFGKSVYIVAEKNKKDIISYDDVSYKMPPDEHEIFKKKAVKYQSDYYKNNFSDKLKKYRKSKEYKI